MIYLSEVCLLWRGSETRSPMCHHSGNQDRFKWNMAKVPNGERVVAMKGDSLRSLAGLVASGLSSSFDAIYVDAS